MLITPQAAKKALARRKNFTPKEIELDPNFPQQNSFVLDPNRFIAAQCSRRAGKTNGLGLRFFKTMAKYPGGQSIYLALTFESAKDIMMPVLHEIDEKYGIGGKFTESTYTHPNGHKLKLLGADMKNFIKRLRGRKYPAVGVDEAQDFGTHLQSLIDDVLTPATSDYEDGWIAVTGTPGPVPHGYFFDITHNGKFGYSRHGWTLLDNPHMPNPERFIEDLKKKREWEDNNPTLLREYRNKWVLDVESLWIRYKENLNHYNFMPPGQYNYILGIDIGFKDADALAVVAWSDRSKEVYLVEEVISTKHGLTELVDNINALRSKYDISKMVIDEGGLGKKLAEEMRRRHAIPVHPADKTRKQETVEFLNDYLRRGLFKARSNSRFATDSYLVQIDWEKSTPNKIVIKKKPHSDIIDAVLYAFKESPAFAYVEPPKKPAYGSKEWAEQEEDGMLEHALQHHTPKSDMDRWQDGEDPFEDF